MIVAEKNNDLEQAGLGRTVQAKIKASRKLFSFFADGVYSNKPVAILRELVANAVDSHVMAGRPNVPVEVILPTVFDSTFTVRDFGTGMSEDFLFNNYLVYAEGSTKDGSNEAIGGFGIGKAAVFSYTDQFSLVSIQDGVKGVYSVFVGEDGIPAISQISVTTTDDHNGVEISFPVAIDDIETFHEAAKTALAYFNPLPKVENGTINAPDYSFVGNKRALRGDAGELGVILGGVRYPVLAANLEHDLRSDQRLSPLLGYGIDLTMPIGSVGVALSREALSYDKRTSDAIRTALEGIFDDVKQTFGTMFDNEPTLWAAKAKLYQETGMTNAYSQNARQKLLAANAVYKGQPLTTNLYVEKLTGGKVWLIEAKRRWGRQKSIKTPTWESFADTRLLIPGDTETVIVDDMAATPKSKIGQRLYEFVAQAPRDKQIVVIRPTKPTDIQQAPAKADIDALLDALGNPEVKLVSDLPLPLTVTQAKVKNVRPNVRMFTWNGKSVKDGVYNYNSSPTTNLTPARWKPVKSIPYADQPETGIMVVMDNFELPENFHAQMRTGLVTYDELYFVNKMDEPKLTKFENFTDVFAARLKVAKRKLPRDIAQRFAVDEAAQGEAVFNYIKRVSDEKRISPWTKLTDDQKATPFGQLVQLYVDYIEPITADQEKFRPFITAKLPDNTDIPALLVAFTKTQDEVKLVLELLNPSYGAPRLTARHEALLLRTI